MNIVDAVIKGVLDIEELDPFDEVDMKKMIFRKSQCMSCKFRIPVVNMCSSCLCYLNTKWKSKVNRNMKTGEKELTHCPKAFWGDADIVNYYKNLKNDQKT